MKSKYTIGAMIGNAISTHILEVMQGICQAAKSMNANVLFFLGIHCGFYYKLNELEDIKTAVSEAVTNAIVHGYPDSIGKVAVKARICPGSILEITVKDHGRGISDVEKARQPMFTTGGEERSGMGFTIMESFMDQLTVRSVPGRGTVVSMKKKLAPRLKTGK